VSRSYLLVSNIPIMRRQVSGLKADQLLLCRACCSSARPVRIHRLEPAPYGGVDSRGRAICRGRRVPSGGRWLQADKNKARSRDHVRCSRWSVGHMNASRNRCSIVDKDVSIKEKLLILKLKLFKLLATKQRACLIYNHAAYRTSPLVQQTGPPDQPISPANWTTRPDLLA